MTIPATPGDEPAELRLLLRGDLLVPDDAGFAAAVAGFPPASRPRWVVIADHADDVAAATRYAADRNLTVAVRAGGQGAVGADADLLITTDRMNTVAVDPQHRRATVAAGTRWSSVNAATAPHGLAPLNGWSPEAGVIGETLAGGLGPLSRTAGCAADQVRRMTLVSATGEVLDVDPVGHPELFWFLCGGGGQIGVVTELEFGLVELSRCYGGTLVYPGEAASSLLHAFRGWCRWLPDQATASMALRRLPDHRTVPAALRGRLTVRLRFLLTGRDDGQQLLAPMRQVATPVVDTVGDIDYHDLTLEPDPLVTVVDPEPDVGAVAANQHDGLLLGGFGTDTAEALLAVAGPDAAAAAGVVEIQQLGGAMAGGPRGGNATGGRDAAFALRVAGPADWTGPVLRTMTPWAAGRHLNLLGRTADTAQIRRAWSPEVYLRLLRIKRRYDPADLFRAGHPLRGPRVYPPPRTVVDTSPTAAGGDDVPTGRM